MSKRYDINVYIKTAYLEHESKPDEDRFVFAYTITITNSGSVAARLLSRHWIVSNAYGSVFDIQGEGVVGQQPYLPPGRAYKYTSGAILDTPVGTMQGAYQMVADDGKLFEATIQIFTLAMPGQLH